MSNLDYLMTHHPVMINGALLPADQARVSIFDHGLLYGDGLYETLRVYGGRFFRLAAHLQRLETGAAQLGLTLPWSREELAEAIRETVRANGMTDAAARLTVTRGEGAPFPDPSLCAAPTYFVTVRPAPPLPPSLPLPLLHSVCFAGRHPLLFVPGVKLLAYLPFQQARVEARARGFHDALLADGERLVEASASNVFLVRDGELLTPSLESGCLPGITRAAVLELARDLGVPTRETAVPPGCAEGADELFLTNSGMEIQPVTRVERREIPAGPLTSMLQRALRELIERELCD